jgi:hypothetical protein
MKESDHFWVSTLCLKRSSPTTLQHIVCSIHKPIGKDTWHVANAPRPYTEGVPPTDTGQTDMKLAQQVAYVLTKLEGTS